MTAYDSYFEYRQVEPRDYAGYVVPAYLHRTLSSVPDARILDFGCGFGQLALTLKKCGFAGVEGLDISPPAMVFCREQGLTCHDGRDDAFFEGHRGTYDFVVMSHVLEHFPKEEVVPVLTRMRALLKSGGGLIVMVPNAQSHTGAYWAYEDFTHHTLFTSGSLYYVLRSAGFRTVEFLDPATLEGLSPLKQIVKRTLLTLYRANYLFWLRVTSSAIHQPSPIIFGYEVRALARE